MFTYLDGAGYLDGTGPACLQADDEILRSAVRLIRRFHGVAAGQVATPAARAVSIDVVCYNDLSSCTFVFRAVFPVALIAFDAAASGSLAYELGYAAWLLLDLVRLAPAYPSSAGI